MFNAPESRTRIALISTAVAKSGTAILPAGKAKTLAECFVKYDDELTFWYDTPDHSTHMVSSRKLEAVNV